MECQDKSVERAARQSAMTLLLGRATAIFTCLVTGGLHHGPLTFIGLPLISWRVKLLCVCETAILKSMTNIVVGMNAIMLDTHPSTRKLSDEVCRALCSLTLQDGPKVLYRIPVIVFNTSSHMSNIIKLVL